MNQAIEGLRTENRFLSIFITIVVLAAGAGFSALQSAQPEVAEGLQSAVCEECPVCAEDQPVAPDLVQVLSTDIFGETPGGEDEGSGE
ncbi:hypothetical protein K0U83_25425 [bacterium]|nr:hypothetical protein [bacterium]